MEFVKNEPTEWVSKIVLVPNPKPEDHHRWQGHEQGDQAHTPQLANDRPTSCQSERGQVHLKTGSDRQLPPAGHRRRVQVHHDLQVTAGSEAVQKARDGNLMRIGDFSTHSGIRGQRPERCGQHDRRPVRLWREHRGTRS